MRALIIRLCPIVLVALAGCTESSAIPDIAPVDLSVDTMKAVTKEISSNRYEGRAPGGPGEALTVAYLEKRFAEAGLKPGNNGSWTQDVPLVEITARNMSPLTFTGKGAPMALSYGPEFTAATYRVTPHVAVKDSDVVFVGYGINAPEKGWNDYAGVDVRGKTVLILVNDPDWRTKDLNGPFGGRAMTYYGRWTYKYEEAARQGAAAAIIIHQTEPAAYGWNVVQSSWTGAQHVADAANGHADQSAAIGWIQLPLAQKLFTGAGLDFAKLEAAAGQKGFKAVPLGVKASLSFDNDIKKQMSNNIVGLLPGTERPNEYVIYSAHWDHLGHCGAVDGDDICNGAIDNATGVAALVALAEAYKKAGPAKRSVVFLAVTAEESGLLGSAYYGDHPIFPLADTVGGVNMDALPMRGASHDVVVRGKGKSDLDAYLDAALKKVGRTASAEPTPEKGLYYRSDHFSFAKHGVPMADFVAGENLVQGGPAAGRAAAQDYEDHRYHAPSDAYRDDWDWSSAMENMKLYYMVGRMLADSKAWPNWTQGDEFRAIRDKSRAGK